MQTPNLQPDDQGDPSGYGLGWYAGTRHGFSWWQHNGAMSGTQANLVVRDDGEMAFAYATNSVGSGDFHSGNFTAMILDHMDTIDDAGAWPATDHFRAWNSAYDTWAQTEFGFTATSRPGLAEVIAPDADPEGDGRSNALEAFLGSDPLEVDPGKWYTLILSDTELTLRWNRRNGDRGVVATPRRSSNLDSWFDNPTDIVNRPDLINLVGYTYQEVKLARSSLTKRFIRLDLATP
jgi:hypothetical protein